MGHVSAVVADTHVLIWYAQNSSRLSAVAGEVLDRATAADAPIFVSAASLVELQYLKEKGTLTAEQHRAVLDTFDAPDSGFEAAPVDEEIAFAVHAAPRATVPDPFDRMIAATAVALGAPLVTADKKLHDVAAVETVW